MEQDTEVYDLQESRVSVRPIWRMTLMAGHSWNYSAPLSLRRVLGLSAKMGCAAFLLSLQCRQRTRVDHFLSHLRQSGGAVRRLLNLGV